jgi:hypothetical protein
VPALLAAGGGIAIVLERIARGAGATRWYGLLGEEQFDALLESLSPGSRVSFYFDGRIAVARFGEDVAEDVLRVAADDHDAVLGVFTPDGREMVVELIAGPHDLDEFSRNVDTSAFVFYGRFPAPDNDGLTAVTLILPDADGTVRPHPH